ncbi:hypothetical protein JXC34_03710 [Candidatus Woesearchaeota archaeon]|nr:hypothetical protein [Candidatus Woesearchaeota archaeon]
MKIVKFLQKCTKKMEWYDISMLKLSVFFFTLFLVTAWPAFMYLAIGISWYWYLILGLVFAAPLLKKMFWK